MKTQEEYAREIDEIVRRDVESCQSDWFKIDKEIFMQPKNKNKIFILGTRKTGCDLIILGGTNCDEGSMDWLFGSLGNENFYVCQPLSFYKSQREIQKVNPLVNHLGIDLCDCGSEHKVGECECGSQKAHDTLGIKYDSFEAILKNFG